MEFITNNIWIILIIVFAIVAITVEESIKKGKRKRKLFEEKFKEITAKSILGRKILGKKLSWIIYLANDYLQKLPGGTNKGYPILVMETDENGNETSSEYYNENLSRVLYEDATIYEYRYNEEGLIEEKTDMQGGIYSFKYNENFRLISKTYMGEEPETFEYGDEKMEIIKTSPGVGKTCYRYESEVNKDGAKEYYLNTIVHPNGNSEQFIYDYKNRLSIIRKHPGTTEFFCYNNDNELTVKTCGKNKKTTYSQSFLIEEPVNE